MSNMKKAKSRIVDNLATTLLGVLLIVFCIYMVYAEKMTMSEVSGWFTLGLGLLRSKNSLIGLPAKQS